MPVKTITCYVCGDVATVIKTGNALCAYHGSEDGFGELETKALKDTFGDNPYQEDCETEQEI